MQCPLSFPAVLLSFRPCFTPLFSLHPIYLYLHVFLTSAFFLFFHFNSFVNQSPLFSFSYIPRFLPSKRPASSPFPRLCFSIRYHPSGYTGLQPRRPILPKRYRGKNIAVISARSRGLAIMTASAFSPSTYLTEATQKCVCFSPTENECAYTLDYTTD